MVRVRPLKAPKNRRKIEGAGIPRKMLGVRFCIPCVPLYLCILRRFTCTLRVYSTLITEVGSNTPELVTWAPGRRDLCLDPDILAPNTDPDCTNLGTLGAYCLVGDQS